MHRSTNQPATTVRVWDIAVRLTHWLVAACVVANLFILEEGERPHRWLGYLACSLIAIRVIWGFVGSRHARFTDWFPTPGRLIPYLKQMMIGEQPRVVGHNPAGAVMMLLMWLLILSLGTTGYLMGTDAYFGEEWLEEVHEILANALLGCVILHVAAALVESRRHRENLVASMITGNKRAE
ncbi:cytochrome b/b6 domain-containing protein [Chitinimonas naiadis]